MANAGDVEQAKEELQLDGYDHFYKLKKFKTGLRERMVYNIDDRRNRAAVRIGNMKLLRGM